jgi:Cu/Ag efflux protein CusF
MKKLVIVVAVMGLLFGAWGWLSMARAQEETGAMRADAFGYITSIDVGAKKITVTHEISGNKNDTDLIVEDSTLIMMHGKKVTLAELSIGEQVAAAYRVDDNGQNVAMSIFEMTKEPGKK